MDLKGVLNQIAAELRTGRFTSEAQVSQGIVLKLLNTLNWPTFDIRVVIPEYAVGGRRVDFALCHPPTKALLFVEVKQVGNSAGADRQLFEYAFHEGVPMAVLTDGQEWSVYLPAQQGQYQDRRLIKLDLLEQDADELTRRLSRYLSYDRVCSGEALKSANADFVDVSRTRTVGDTIPKAWKQLLSEQDSILVELLADKVESLCGFKPDADTVASFLSSIDKGITNPAREPRRADTVAPREVSRKPVPLGPVISGQGFEVNGAVVHTRSAKETMIEALRVLAKQDPTFLARLAARPKHGRSRRYVARSREELYPDAPHLIDSSEELVPGWWVGTNYNKGVLDRILRMACEVANLRYGKDLIANL